MLKLKLRLMLLLLLLLLLHVILRYHPLITRTSHARGRGRRGRYQRRRLDKGSVVVAVGVYNGRLA